MNAFLKECIKPNFATDIFIENTSILLNEPSKGISRKVNQKLNIK